MNENNHEKIIFVLSIINVAISAIIAYLQKKEVDKGNDTGN